MDWYFGKEEADEWGDIISEEYSGWIISKRIADEDEENSLKNVSEALGMEDLFILLRALEGMCCDGRAREINDSEYEIL